MLNIFLYLVSTLIFSSSYFTECKDCTRKQMATHYRPMIEYVAEQTDLPQHLIWGYFIMETGGKSNALVNYNNPAGIMECIGNNCQVKKFNTPLDGISAWIRVLNNKAYKVAKTYKGEQLYIQMGCIYHPDSSHKLRYQVGRTWKTK